MVKKYGPWKIKSSRLIYKNSWMKVIEDKVIRPDKKPGIYTYVKLTPGVFIVPIDKKGYIYLIKEFKYPLKKHILVTCAGGIEKNEPPLKAAKRELEEELGIRAKKWTYLGEYQPLTSFAVIPIHLFLARKLKFTTKRHEGTESIKLIRMKLSKAVKLIQENKITASNAAFAILRAKEYLKTKLKKTL